ncbi:MAG: hypothetical protein IPJ20_08215 [Flammeovirgaceae bacterium]|nr:hypothetical protein [Flammeovirgaceae bacterium]
MITVSNYFIEVERIGVNTLLETLQKGHDLVGEEYIQWSELGHRSK